MSDEALNIWLGRIGGDEWWVATTTIDGDEIRGEGPTRFAALTDLASILSVSLGSESER